MRTICDIDSTLSQGLYIGTVTLPDGRQIEISGDLDKPGDWQVDGAAAVIVNPRDLSRPCYRTATLELCVGR
jgi:hypothetical protein